jgi:hypothetical protein
MAISTTLFLFIHTRELHTKLKAMEVKLQPEDVLSGKCGPIPDADLSFPSTSYGKFPPVELKYKFV